MSVHYWLVLHPDISRPIGGVKQMHRLAEAIVSFGRQATIIQDNAAFHPSWFVSTVDTISHKDWLILRDTDQLGPEDVIIFPETFLQAIPSYSLGLPSVIFNQNSSYTFGIPGSSSILTPSFVFDLYNLNYIKHVLCVSQYDLNFLSNYLLETPGKVSCIVNGLENSLFKPLASKKKRIAFMPRKNKKDSVIVTSLLRRIPSLKDWTFVSIDGLPHHDVINLLRSSIIFLSFGHPEGFGLPVAEALGCGCVVVGYTGLGGNELFDISSKHNVAFPVAFGDWSGFLSAVLEIDRQLKSEPQALFQHLLSSSAHIKSIYNQDQMFNSIVSALRKIENSL